MKAALLAFLASLLPVTAVAQNNSPRHAPGDIPPEIVRLEKIKVVDDMKMVTMGNAKRSYWLICNVKAEGCITPDTDTDYLLFDKNTRWMMPGAKKALTLEGLQDWTVKYNNNAENIGLISQMAKADIGMFFLDPVTQPGAYAQDTVFSDGPIIYGTGMSDQDRQAAWKHFFMKMVEASVRQQGQEAVGLKLKKRCQPGENFCTTVIDANLVGIGGIQEPRKVVVIVATDARDQNKQLARTVCTWPAKDKRVCRDFDTGKLMDTD
jgi:hypothetical protein